MTSGASARTTGAMGDSPDNSDTPPWSSEQDEAAPTAAELEAAGQNSMFGGEPEAPAPEPVAPKPAADTANQPYRVLARKYRPQTFAELIGQEPMVQTLANAIKRVLARSVRQGGTTLRDFVGSDGNPGYFKQQLNVYGRQDKPCRVCAKPLKLQILGQRSTVYCPNCQTSQGFVPPKC